MSKEPVSPYKMNLPTSLKERIEDVARQNGRSLSAEIITRLEKSFESDEEWINALDNINDALSRIETLERQVSDLMYTTGRRDFPGNED